MTGFCISTDHLAPVACSRPGSPAHCPLPTAGRDSLAPRQWMSSEEHGNGVEWLADSPGASRSRWWMETEAETIETD